MVGTYPARGQYASAPVSWWDQICKKTATTAAMMRKPNRPPFSLWHLLVYRGGANKKAIALLFLPDFLDEHDVSASR